MKKKLLALVCALALTVSLVGCVFSTPDTVGKIGDFEVTSGLYLLAQYDTYQQAAQLAGSEQDASKVKSFLKATITTDADTGETAVVSDYVAQKTLETLQTLAAVDARFTELGGELTEEQFSDYLYSAGIPDPELIIRPSGEIRTSNFLLWQSAYSEYYFTDVLWPDFKTSDLDAAIDNFNSRNRRFGGV